MRVERFDVVVVGCGAGGLSAAVSAAEAGARVAVLERAPKAERGGQSRYTEAYLRMKSHTGSPTISRSIWPRTVPATSTPI